MKMHSNEELELSETMYRLIFQNATDAIFWADSGSGVIINCNKAAEDLLERDISEIVGQHHTILHPPNKLDYFQEMFKQHVDESGAMDVDAEVITKSGRIIPVHITSNLTEVDGKVVNQGIFRDITTRKRLEKKLDYSSHLMQYIISHARSAIAVHDTELKYVYVSNSYLEQYQVKEKDVIGKHHYEVFPDLPQKWRDVHQRALKGEVCSAEDDPYYKDDGTVDWTRWECRPWYDLDGSIGGIIVYTEVITERKQKEIEITEERNKYQSILASIGDGVTIRDKHYNVIFQNEYVDQVFGDKVGEKCYTAYEGRQSVCEDCPVELAFSDGESHSAIREVVMPDGSIGYWDNTASPIRNADGNIISCVEVARNITEKKEAEKEKEALQRQLLQSQKMEAIGILAGGVAHDFNNLLGIILGSAQLAQFDIDKDSDAATEIKVILETAVRAKALTSKLLTFARKDSVKMSLNNIGDIIAEVQSLLERSLPKSISIEIACEPDLAIHCDSNQIHQVLMNLCTNAADAMPTGGKLTIESKRVVFDEAVCGTCGKELSGPYCMIQVTDTGIGIPKDLLPKIVDPFFTTKDIGKGTGLGLSVTHGIVSSHKGHLHIYSEKWKGTNISIYLPIGDVSSGEAEAATQKIQISGDETILVVDDEQAMLRMAGRLLEKNGYTPILASSGKQAIEIFSNNFECISVVILDLMMPDMDGAEVFMELKQIDPDVKIIFASGLSINRQAHELMKDQSHEFVQKPYDVETLCQAIRGLIEKEA